MPAGIGAIPVNQLNAIPILTADQAAAPGDITIVGQQVSRYFSPSVLGFNAVPGATTIVGAQIDLRCMNSFVVNMARTVTAGSDVGEDLTLRLLYSGQTSADMAAPFSSTLLGIATLTMPVYGGAGTHNFVYAWNSAVLPGVSGGKVSLVATGSNIRLGLASSAPNAARTFSLEMWAQT